MKEKLILTAGVVTVIAAIAYGLRETGGPAMQRKLRVDSTRIERLSRIDNAVRNYYRDKDKLPATLAELQKHDRAYLYNEDDTLDPLSKESFTYRAVSKNTYELCANFETDTDKNRARDGQGYRYNHYHNIDWQHPQGPHCFSLEAEPRKP